MNIGIDLDGVLTDIQGFNHKYAPSFFQKMFNKEAVDENPYDIRDIFNCSESEYREYWKKHIVKYVVFEPARKGAKIFTRYLHTDGHKIYIITKRVFTCRDTFGGRVMRIVVKNWLWRNRVRYDEVVFCDNDVPDSKRIACLENKIDVMVDDEEVNINAIAPIAKVICYDTSYNRDCEGENIFRAENFKDAYKLIQGFK